MFKKAAYCFDDELVADMPTVDISRNKKVSCSKCKAKPTPHPSGVCIDCRTSRCINCGTLVRRTIIRSRCTYCHKEYQRKLREGVGFTEDDLNGN